MTADPDGMALICQLCGWRPDEALTQGVVSAHFETEHDSTDVRLELVVLCPCCDKPMRYERSAEMRSGAARDFFSCPTCHRTRTILRQPEVGP